jgi:hypothetical protein
VCYLEAALEPLYGLITLDLVCRADRGLATTTFSNTLTRAGPTIYQPGPYQCPKVLQTYMQQ